MPNPRLRRCAQVIARRFSQEAVVEHPAAQVGIELLAHVLGQRAVFRGKSRKQIRVVRLHQRVQQRALGNVASVGRGGGQGGRCGAGDARRLASLRRGKTQHGTLLGSDGWTGLRAASAPSISIPPAHA